MFFSLEMNEVGVKYILLNQVKRMTAEQRAKLNDNLIIVPRGYSMGLDEIERLVRQVQPDGVFIDTMSDTAKKELTDESEARRIVSWDALLRNELGIFTWWNHHTRKANSDNKAPVKISDVYGSFLYAAKMESIMILHGSRDNKGPIRWFKPKIRYGQSDKDGTDIFRDNATLTFDLKKGEKTFSVSPDPKPVDGPSGTSPPM
jgi:hypothetical protein